MTKIWIIAAMLIGVVGCAESGGGSAKSDPKVRMANTHARGLVERKLMVVEGRNAYDANANLQTFGADFIDTDLTIKYDFNSGSHTGLNIAKTMANCVEVTNVRIIGPGHNPSESVKDMSWNQSLHRFSDYSIEMDISPDCAGAYVNVIAWLGDISGKPIIVR